MILFSNAQSRSALDRAILGAMKGFGFGVLALAGSMAVAGCGPDGLLDPVAGDPFAIPMAEVYPLAIGVMLDGSRLEAAGR